MTVIEVSSPTLGELAQRANSEHAEVLSGIRAAVVHAINAGDALLQAREMVPRGEWLDWLAANFSGSQVTGQQYMRLAFYKAEILSASEPLPLKRAYTYIRGFPAIDGRSGRGRRSAPREEDVAEARRLRNQGMSYAAIGEVFGMSGKVINTWLNPAARKRHNEKRKREYARRKAARIALEQKERESAAKKAGGALGESYSLLRKTAQALDRASREAGSRDDRAAILDALQAVYRADDHLVRALGIQHGQHARARTFQVAEEIAA